MRNMVLSVVGILAFLTQASLVRAEEMKVGVVDMQKALQSVEAGKKAKSQLEKEVNSKRTEVDKERASIEKMGNEFKKQSLVLSDDARAKKQAELQERIAKFQEMAQKSQLDLQQKERSLTEPIIAKLRTIVGDVAKTKGYSMVLEKNENTVLFSQDKDDLTNDIITIFNKNNKG